MTRGAGSRKAALAMAYKLLDAAQVRWHRIAGPELVPLVRAGATFVDGKLHEKERCRDPRERGRRGLSQKPHPQHLTISPVVREPAEGVWQLREALCSQSRGLGCSP